MSLKERKDAVDLIATTLYIAYSTPVSIDYDRAVASSILNKLFKAGCLNDKISVNANEVKEEVDQAIFKCGTRG